MTSSAPVPLDAKAQLRKTMGFWDLLLAGIAAGKFPLSESFPSPGGSGHEIRERFPLDGVKAFFFPGIRAHLQPIPVPICYFHRLCFIC